MAAFSKISKACDFSQTCSGHVTRLTSAVLASLALLASPALANSASVDIAMPQQGAMTADHAQSVSDAGFHQLFSSWRALDKGAGYVAVSKGDFGSGVTGVGVGVGGGVGDGLGVAGAVAIPSGMPLNGYRLTSTFGMREHPVLGGWRMHKGVDLADPMGTPVHATANGVVGRANWFSGYGLYIEIEHGGAIETRYGHMSRLNVAAGQQVHKGDIIGFVGATGRATGPHLHYEVRVDGVAVNPLPYMEGEITAASTNSVSAGLPSATKTSSSMDGDSGED